MPLKKKIPDFSMQTDKMSYLATVDTVR